jgi:uncharacterized protein
MQIREDRLVVSPSDLSTHLTCPRKTSLDLGVALQVLRKPTWRSALSDVLAKRGSAHEQAHLATLREQGLQLEDLTGEDDPTKTEAAMRKGVDVIVQAPLERNGWFGYADILRRVSAPSALGDYSYEVEDTKLTRETKGGTILQLCAYTDMVAGIQHALPNAFHVVTPVKRETYRVDDFSAYYRVVKQRFAETLGDSIGAVPPAYVEPPGIPAPVDFCEMCRWWTRCDRQRRDADHLSFVAGIRRSNRDELVDRAIPTMKRLAEELVPIAWQPARGARSTYDRLGNQARLQVQQRETGRPQVERLPVEPDAGLSRLPVPSDGDLFIDLEGDPFGRTGLGVEPGDGTREYLFGVGRQVNGTWIYEHRWAWSDAEEKAACEWVLDNIASALAAAPACHVYHFGAYEASAFKRLASRYATREPDLDVLLREARFVDLYAVTRQAVRCGVESYSIKDLERFYEFTREVDLRDAGDKRRLIEAALEAGDLAPISESDKTTVVGYNQDDCRSTLGLRNWLEAIRSEMVAAGNDVPRPTLKESEASTATEADRKAAGLRNRLLSGVPMEHSARSPEQQARWLMAFLIEWHRREERVAWGEYHRIREMTTEDLEQEPTALVGLRYVERVQTPGGKIRTAIDRYSFEPQPVEIKEGDQLKLPDDSALGVVVAIARDAGFIDIKKTQASNDLHPSVVIQLSIVATQAMKDSLFREGEQIANIGLDDVQGDRLINDLLLRRAPRLTSGPFQCPASDVTEAVVKITSAFDGTVLPIQGPPGTGKTFTGARMIRALVQAGKKVGVVANSHKVIANLLDDVIAQAVEAGETVRVGQKGDEDDARAEGAARLKDGKQALQALAADELDVVGGTAWLWADGKFRKSVDVLFVDEAGQMSLANVLAVTPATANLVLLGDPQQLQQPKKGSHPEGCDVSALEHLLAGAAVVPPDRGILLPMTWRMAPRLTAFTSATFYSGKLSSRPELERQVLTGTGFCDGAGLWTVHVKHEGNQNYSIEEVDAVEAIVNRLLSNGLWTNADGESKRLTAADMLIVAPYNAQVTRLAERLQPRGLAVGTVDRFQGQEAPVAIYSMASSSAEDAPRGMEFLFSHNRLNVATSRARCAAILVASPRLFGPDCISPRQMLLANALCKYAEMASVVAP